MPMAFVFDRPSAFKRPSLLIVGCGDIGLRVAALLRGRWRLLALTSSPERIAELRAAGITPLLGDLDDAPSLARLADLADALLYLAPPASHGSTERRMTTLLHAMARGSRLQHIVYVSTSGVFGDWAGARIDETRRPAPASERAQRRLDAELSLRLHGRAFGVRVTLLRVPGIYGRGEGGPLERVARGAPLPAHADTVYTSHIHADDLARACVAALHRGQPQRVIHVSDDSEIRLGAYFDLAADLSGQPRLKRVSEMEAPLPAPALPTESRRLLNTRLKQELRLRLRYPTVAEGLAALEHQRRRLPKGG
jgi:nucleoside-diphosphate-sugar epimerase